MFIIYFLYTYYNLTYACMYVYIESIMLFDLFSHIYMYALFLTHFFLFYFSTGRYQSGYQWSPPFTIITIRSITHMVPYFICPCGTSFTFCQLDPTPGLLSLPYVLYRCASAGSPTQPPLPLIFCYGELLFFPYPLPCSFSLLAFSHLFFFFAYLLL